MKPTLSFFIAIVCLCLVASCDNTSRPNGKTNQIGIAKLYQAKQGTLVCIMYADAHEGQYPPNLMDAAGHLGTGYVSTNFLVQLAANFDLVYSGASTNIAKPYATIILKEKQAWQSPGGGKLLKTYGFADGHAEIHRSEDGDFDKWEAERIIKP